MPVAEARPGGAGTDAGTGTTPATAPAPTSGRAVEVTWRGPPLGLGPCAEAGLVAGCLDAIGLGVSPATLRVASGHAFRVCLAPPGDPRAWEAALGFGGPAPDPWAWASAVAGTEVERVVLAPADAAARAGEWLALGRPVVLAASPGERPPGLVLGARPDARPGAGHGGELLVWAPELRPATPAAASPPPAWLPAAALGAQVALLLVHDVDRDDVTQAPTAGLERALAVLKGSLPEAVAHGTTRVRVGGLGRGLAAYPLLVKHLDPKLAEADLAGHDALLTTVLADLVVARTSAAAGLTEVAAALVALGRDAAADAAWAAADAYGRVSRVLGEVAASLSFARRDGLDAAETTLTSPKVLASAAGAVVEAERAEVAALAGLSGLVRVL